MTVLYEISLGNNQFSSLRKDIPEISEHILASRIANLIEQGLITKEGIANTVPLQIIYEVTAKGQQLLSLVDGLYQWKRYWDE